MKVLITGSKGFIGRNLVKTLQYYDDMELMTFDRTSNPKLLDSYIKKCDFIIHLAGENRPKNNKEFYKNNSELTETIVLSLLKHNNNAPVFMSSSIKATENSDYGKSKMKAEKSLKRLHEKQGNDIYIYRLPNVFGKWSRPNYNSVIATWCYQISHGESIRVKNPNKKLTLVYIDDLIDEILLCLEGKIKKNNTGYYNVKKVYTKTLLEIAETIKCFSSKNETLYVPDMNDEFVKKLYSTYYTYITNNEFKRCLKMHEDDRGSFTELIKSNSAGQVSVNIMKQGVIKGNHWHHSKFEKFIVVSGTGLIKSRNINTNETVEYKVSGDCIEVIDIIPGYTHSIQNIGQEDLVTIIWVNEPFDSENPDTYYEEI